MEGNNAETGQILHLLKHGFCVGEEQEEIAGWLRFEMGELKGNTLSLCCGSTTGS